MVKSTSANTVSFLALGVALGALLVTVLSPGSIGEPGPAGSNGLPGSNGSNGQPGSQGSTGLPGSNGLPGSQGVDGKTPYVGNNGNWWIDGGDTGVPANNFNQTYRDVPNIEFRETQEELALYSQSLVVPFSGDEFRLDYANELIDKEGFIGIATPADLMGISNKTGKYVLTADLDFSEYVNWSPINFTTDGIHDPNFSGIFDGAGFSIVGLSHTNLDLTAIYYNYGLFEGLQGATIRHLNLLATSISVPEIDGRFRDGAGALAGNAYESTLYNIEANLIAISGANYIGGLVGGLDSSQASFIVLENAMVEGVDYVGGLFGTVDDSMITHVLADTIITTAGNQIGGITGQSQFSTYILIESTFTKAISENPNAINQTEIGGVIGQSNQDRLYGIYTDGSIEFQPPAAEFSLSRVGGVIGFGENLMVGEVRNNIFIRIFMGDEFTITEIKSIGGVVGGVDFGTLIGVANYGEVAIFKPAGEFDENYYLGEASFPYIGGNDSPIEYLGGVVGYAYSSLNLYQVANFGFVAGIVEVGGILGSSGGGYIPTSQLIVANEVANFGDVSGDILVGGFTGLNDGLTNLILANFMNYAFISAREIAGGLIGLASPMMGINVAVINSYNEGRISVTDFGAGGLIGAIFPMIYDDYYGFPFYELQLFSGQVSISNSFNFGQIIVENLGLEVEDFFQGGSGSIIGLRISLAIMDGVSYVEEEIDVDQFVFDDVNSVYIPTGEFITMVVPGVGAGNLVDVFMIQGESVYTTEEFFLYQTIWNFETIWARSPDSLIVGLNLPFLQFLAEFTLLL